MRRYLVGLLVCLVLVTLWTASCQPAPSARRLALPERHKALSYRAMWFDPKDPDVVFASRSDGVYQSDDKGVRWENLASATDSDTRFLVFLDRLKLAGLPVPNLLAVEVLSDLEVLVSAEEYDLKRINTEKLIPESVESLSDMLVLTTTQTKDGAVYAGTLDGKVAKLSPNGILEVLEEVFLGESVVGITIGPDGDIYALSDAANLKVRSGESITTPIPTWITSTLVFRIAPATALLYNPENAKWYAASRDTVYRSLGPEKWESLEAEFSEPVSNIVINPHSSRILYVVTPTEIWRSTDFGTSWRLVLPAPTPTSTTIPKSTHTATPTHLPTASAPLVVTATSTSISTPASTLSPMSITTRTPTATRVPTSTPTQTPTQTPTATPIPTATPHFVAGRYCVYAKKKLPVEIGEHLRLHIAMSTTETPPRPEGFVSLIGNGDIDVYPQMWVRIIGPDVEDPDDLKKPRAPGGLEWDVSIISDRALKPEDFLMQVAHSDPGLWQDIKLVETPEFVETWQDRYGREALVGAIATIVAALLSSAATLYAIRLQRRHPR